MGFKIVQRKLSKAKTFKVLYALMMTKKVEIVDVLRFLNYCLVEFKEKVFFRFLLLFNETKRH